MWSFTAETDPRGRDNKGEKGSCQEPLRHFFFTLCFIIPCSLRNRSNLQSSAFFPLAEYLVQGASNYSRRKTECLKDVKLLNFNRYGRRLFTFLFTSDVSFILCINFERSGSRSASMGLKGFLGKAKRWTWSIQSYCLLSEASRKTGGRRDLEVWPIAVSAPSILITDPPLSVGHLLSRRVMGKGWGIGTALLHFLCCSERQSARRMFAVISKRDWLSRSWIKEGI